MISCLEVLSWNYSQRWHGYFEYLILICSITCHATESPTLVSLAKLEENINASRDDRLTIVYEAAAGSSRSLGTRHDTSRIEYDPDASIKSWSQQQLCNTQFSLGVLMRHQKCDSVCLCDLNNNRMPLNQERRERQNARRMFFFEVCSSIPINNVSKNMISSFNGLLLVHPFILFSSRYSYTSALI